jgi:hypothetical protein
VTATGTAGPKRVAATPGPASRRRPQPQHAPRVPFALLLVGLIVGGMCALLALNTASAANELARHELATKDTDVAARLEQVRNEVAASAAPGSLGSAAAALGMVPAGAPAFLNVDANGKVVLLGSPAPASPAPAPPPPAKATVTPAKPQGPATTPAKTPATTPATTARTPATTPATTARRTAGKPAPAKPRTPSPTPPATTTLPGGTR